MPHQPVSVKRLVTLAIPFALGFAAGYWTVDHPTADSDPLEKVTNRVVANASRPTERCQPTAVSLPSQELDRIARVVRQAIGDTRRDVQEEPPAQTAEPANSRRLTAAYHHQLDRALHYVEERAEQGKWTRDDRDEFYGILSELPPQARKSALNSLMIAINTDRIDIESGLLLF